MGGGTERPPPPKEPPSPHTACVIPTIRGTAAIALALVERKKDSSYALVVGVERWGETSPVQTAWRALEEKVGVALAPPQYCGNTPYI